MSKLPRATMIRAATEAPARKVRMERMDDFIMPDPDGDVMVRHANSAILAINPTFDPERPIAVMLSTKSDDRGGAVGLITLLSLEEANELAKSLAIIATPEKVADAMRAVREQCPQDFN